MTAVDARAARRDWKARRRRLRRWEAPPFERPGHATPSKPRLFQVRLLLPVAATWAVMACTVSGRAIPPWLLACAAVGVGLLAALLGSVGARLGRRHAESLTTSDAALATAGSSSTSTTHHLARALTHLTAITLGCALLAAVLAEHALERRDAGVADLAQRGAVATMTGTVLTTPRPLATSIPGAPPQYAVTIAVHQVTGRGTTRHVDTRVTAIAGDDIMARLLPGSEVTATGRLALPSRASDVAATHRLTRLDALAAPAGVRAVPQNLRHTLEAATDSLPADRAGLVRGMTFGDTRLLPAADIDALKAAGLTHLTAVSGANLAIVAGGAALLFRPTRWRRRTKVVALATVIAIFVLAVGYEPSVIRAAGMAGLVLCAQWWGRPRVGLAMLLATALGVLWVDPFMAVNLGFALSVAATAAIIACAKPCAEQFSRVLRLPYVAALPLAVTLVAQLAVTPLLVLLNPSLPTYAVPANLLAAPLVAPLTVLSVASSAAGLAPVLPGVAGTLAWCAGWCAQGVLWVARVAASLPYEALPWPAAPFGLWLAVAAVLLFALTVRFLHKYWFSAIAGCLVLAVGFVGATAYTVQALLPAPPTLTPSFVQCDVGQGDALLLLTGVQGHAVMIDVGPEGDAAADCVAAAGITHLDALVLTHSHADHVGGLDAVLARVTVTRTLAPPANPADPGVWRSVDKALSAHGLTREVAAAGASVRAGAVDARVVGPVSAAAVTSVAAREQGGSEGSWANDSSLVLIGTVGAVRFAALGDLEPAAQRALLSAGPLNRVDIVKVAHHGSPRQTADLYAALAPSVALISVGADNDYGHPGPKTLDLLTRQGVQVLRTDQAGAVGIAEKNGELFEVDVG